MKEQKIDTSGVLSCCCMINFVLSCSRVEFLPKYFCFFHYLLDRNTSY